MLKLKKVAITGGLAAGKSTVCRFFKDLGAYVISSDEIVRRLLSPDTQLGRQVIQLLGTEIVQGDSLNRDRIAEKVFSEPKLLQALEELLHPAVFDVIEQTFEKIAKEGSYPLFIAEVPLLYESERQGHFDLVIAVSAPETTAKQRFGKGEAFDQRMMRQLSPAHKAAKADYVIENSGDLDTLKNQVTKHFHILTQAS
ncbi:MAG: dephospho-CoA kinase [Verrucomicrobia bacterium]|nr:dephospho-CoA kinase [Verrucomicrobiota bacterium]